METRHETVLLEEAVAALSVAPGSVVVDATVGGAGHFARIGALLEGKGTLIGIDADEGALARGRAALEGSAARVALIEDNFRNLSRILDELHVREIDAALFDLGWSAFHLSSGRGFSFRADEPLHMTYGTPEEGKTAADLINGASEEALSDMLFSLGEERFARAIARTIVREREEEPITTTARLAKIVEEAVPGWYRARRIHPATKTFQALRIAVNDELGAIREGVGAALSRLTPGGRVAVITFHSIEDRIVKSMFRDAAHSGMGTVCTKKPVSPSEEEVARNPRSRSAKLRVFEKAGAPEASLAERPHYAYA